MKKSLRYVLYALFIFVIFITYQNCSNSEGISFQESNPIPVPEETEEPSSDPDGSGGSTPTNLEQTSVGEWCNFELGRVSQFSCDRGVPSGIGWVEQPNGCYHRNTDETCNCQTSEEWFENSETTCQLHDIQIIDECGYEKVVTNWPDCIEQNPPAGPGSLCDNVPELKEYAGWSVEIDPRYPFDNRNDGDTFGEIFSPFPGTGNSDDYAIRKKRYVALEFTTPQLSSSSQGRLTREQNTPRAVDVGPGPLLVSISRCPGDFNPVSPGISDGCIFSLPHSFMHVRWGGPNSGEPCELESNTIYYFNMVYADSEPGLMPPDQSECQGKSRCGHLMQANGVL